MSLRIVTWVVLGISIAIQGFFAWERYIYPRPIVFYAVQTARCSGDDRETNFYFSIQEAAEVAKAKTIPCDSVAVAKLTVLPGEVQVHQYFDWSNSRNAEVQLLELGAKGDGRGY